jgi:Spherulation-specific family 4
MRKVTRLVATSTVALLLTVAIVSSGTAGAGASTLLLGVPAYWSPATSHGSEQFAQLASAGGTVNTVVMNGPSSAAPVPFDPRTADTIKSLRRAGVTVLGYVDSGYLGRTGLTTTRISAGSTEIADWVSQIRADVADWYQLYGRYGLGGVFIDQTLSSCGPDRQFIDAYQDALYDVRRGNRGAMVAINPGTAAEECYIDVADAIVMFENTYDMYRGWAPPSWVHNYPAEHFWHLVYDAPSQDEMNDAVNLARQHHAGQVYVSNLPWSVTRSQWDSLPIYWDEELCQVTDGASGCQ